MQNLPQQVLQAAKAKGVTLATAESCTGGMVAAALTDIAGSSAVVLGGVVSYANAVKIAVLQVPPALIETLGAVSEPVALEMAKGARARLGADLAVSTSGIAGPGGSEFKPEGRVCFAVVDALGAFSETVEFGPLGRAQVRQAARDHALRLLLARLQAPEA